MTPQAAKELLDVVMLDDFVSRRDGLNKWTRRWVATLELTHPVPILKGHIYDSGRMHQMARAALTDKAITGLLAGEVPATSLETTERCARCNGVIDERGPDICGCISPEVVRTTTLRMHILLQEPRRP